MSISPVLATPGITPYSQPRHNTDAPASAESFLPGVQQHLPEAGNRTPVPAPASTEESTPEEELSMREKVRTEFHEYMEMTPAERLREQILKEMGLTEEQLEQMPPEERAAIEDKIAALMRERMEEKMRSHMEEAPATAPSQSAAAASAYQTAQTRTTSSDLSLPSIHREEKQPAFLLKV